VFGNANDAPILIANTTPVMPENTHAVWRLEATDPDGDEVQFSIDGGADADAFRLDGQSGELRFADAPDYEAPSDENTDGVYEVRVSASDGRGGVTSALVQVEIANENEAPTLATSDVTISSIDAIGEIGVAVGADPDASDQVTYSIVSSQALAGQFSIDAVTGVLSSASNQLFEGEYSLQIQVTDSDGLSNTSEMKITVLASQSASNSGIPSTNAPGLPTTPDASIAPASDNPVSAQQPEQSEPAAEATATDAESDAAQPPPFDGLPDDIVNRLVQAPQTFANVPEAMVADADREEMRENIDRVIAVGDGPISLTLTIERLLDDLRVGSVEEISAAFDSLTVNLPPDLVSALDRIASENERREATIDLRVSGAVIGSISLSAGFVIWVLRAGSLLGSLLASRPLWSSIDPLPIFWADDEDRETNRG
jgi:hypothetical protein